MANYVDLNNRATQTPSLSSSASFSAILNRVGSTIPAAASSATSTQTTNNTPMSLSSPAAIAVVSFLERLAGSTPPTSDAVLQAVQTEKRVSRAQLRICEKIGEGFFGSVHRGVLRDRTVAVKRIRRAQYRSDSDFDLVVKECAIMSLVNHENIVEFIGICEDGPREFLIVSQFVGGGTVRERIHRHPAHITDAFRVRVITSVAKAMAYMHAWQPRAIIHRDLTTSNILLDEGTSGVAYVCDLGLARIHAGSAIAMTAAVGSLAFMAPELFRGDSYDEKCDVFSFAIVLWEMLSMNSDICQGEVPHMWASHVAMDGRRPSLAGIPQRYCDLLVQLWAPQPQDRPSFVKVLEYIAETLVPQIRARSSAFSRASSSSLSAGSIASLGPGQYVDPDNNSGAGSSHSLPVDIDDGATSAYVESDNTSTFVTKFVGHSGFVCSVYANDDSDTLLTSSTDKTARVWSLSKGTECRHVISGHAGYVFAVTAAVVRSTPLMLTASRDQTIRVLDQCGALLNVLSNGHSGGVRDIQLHDVSLASASEDQTIGLWDVQTGAQVGRLRGHTGPVYSSAWLPGSSFIVLSSADDASVRAWDTRSGSCVTTLREHRAGVQRVRVGAQECDIFSAGKDAQVLRWDARHPSASVVQYNGHRDTVFDLDVQPSLLFSCGADGAVHRYDIDSGQLLQDVKPHEGGILSLKVLRGGQTIVTGGMDKCMAVSTFS